MTDRELMQQALDALTFDGFTPENAPHRKLTMDAVAALRARLAQPDPEPVAWINWNAATGERSVSFFQESELASEPLYAAPQPVREWQGLPYDELSAIWGGFGLALVPVREEISLAIEEALKERNHG